MNEMKLMVEAMKRAADALERIADRLDAIEAQNEEMPEGIVMTQSGPAVVE